VAGRRLDAGLRLLDRQLVDEDGRLAGKVDDLEFTDPRDHSGRPELTALLAGPEALAGRLGTPLGRWLEAIRQWVRGHLIGRIPGAGGAPE
jgi:hypothetical protein